MNFKRGQDVKEALDIGIKTYKLYRLKQFRTRYDPGFDIMGPSATREILEQLSRGELDRPNFIVEFMPGYRRFNGKIDAMLYEMPTAFFEYQYEEKKYLIKSHIDEV
jgi:hypothetical protein